MADLLADHAPGFSLRILVAGERNNLKEAPCLNRKIVIDCRTLAGEFCVVNREFSVAN